MTKKTHVHLSDLAGLNRLATDDHSKINARWLGGNVSDL